MSGHIYGNCSYKQQFLSRRVAVGISFFRQSAVICVYDYSYSAIQMIDITISIPIASYLKLHVPSYNRYNVSQRTLRILHWSQAFSLFQYAPHALCIPLLPVPTPSDPVVEGFDDRCWMMVELTANLYGHPEALSRVDSEHRERRMVVYGWSVL